MKRYVYAMSFPREEALRRAKFYSQDILEHLIKLVVYGSIRKDDVNHWIGEIASWLASVDSLTVKPSNKPLKPQDVRDTTFMCMGDHLEDYYQSLNMFQHDNKKGKFNHEDKVSYPEVTPNYEIASDLMNVCYEVIERATHLICSKEIHSKQQYKEMLQEILNHYL